MFFFLAVDTVDMKPDASTGLYTLVFLDKKGKRLY